MGHSRSQVFERYYTAQVVAADTQSAFLNAPSKDALVKLGGLMSLARDARAKQEVKAMYSKNLAEEDTKVQDLTENVAKLKMEITTRHGLICNSKGTEEYKDFLAVRNKRSARLRQVTRAMQDSV